MKSYCSSVESNERLKLRQTPAHVTMWAVISRHTWKCFGFVRSGMMSWKSLHAYVEIHDASCNYSCMCVPFTGTYVKTLSPLLCRWALFLPAGSTGVKQNNWLIYLYKVLLRVSHFTQQSSWQLFSCHTRMASSYFNGIKTKITKTVCQITNANPVKLMLNVL